MVGQRRRLYGTFLEGLLEQRNVFCIYNAISIEIACRQAGDSGRGFSLNVCLGELQVFFIHYTVFIQIANYKQRSYAVFQIADGLHLSLIIRRKIFFPLLTDKKDGQCYQQEKWEESDCVQSARPFSHGHIAESVTIQNR